MWRAALKVREEAHAKRQQGGSDEEASSLLEGEGQEKIKQMLEASNARCETIIAEAELQLKKAKQAEYEFEFRIAEVDKDLKQAKIARSEAEVYRKKVLKEAQEESRTIRQQARAAATVECAEMKRRMMYEIQSVFGDVCSIATAPPMEPESDVVNMEAGVSDLRGQIMEIIAGAETSMQLGEPSSEAALEEEAARPSKGPRAKNGKGRSRAKTG